MTRLTDAKRGRDRTDQRAQREHRDRRGGDAAWPEAAVVSKYDVRADFACTASTPRSRAIIGKGVEISVLSNDSIVKAAEIRSGSRRLWADTAGPSSYAVCRHAITPSVRARTSGDARQEASAS
jgi:hypothetical protein